MEGITHSSALLHATPLVSLFDHNFHTEVCICRSHCPTPALSLTAQPFCGHQVQGVPEPWNQAAPWALLWPLSSLTPFGIPLSCFPMCPLLSCLFYTFHQFLVVSFCTVSPQYFNFVGGLNYRGFRPFHAYINTAKTL